MPLVVLTRVFQLGEPAYHFSLGMPLYCQITSPLRRYGDLVLHQQLHAYLAGQKLFTIEEVGETREEKQSLIPLPSCISE